MHDNMLYNFLGRALRASIVLGSAAVAKEGEHWD